MEKVKKEVQEYLNKEKPEVDLEHLKLEVNNLLHTFLPPEITVGEMEALAVTIHYMIAVPKDFLSQACGSKQDF